ncbi:carbohydrate ABC transporter permease [Micromonospora inositola]|uniref:Carbohydrate ABC transporter membrane protein 1, CUT1 family n=1 Tax=Micromonospora inositola TaxID=47865 RepID=A0A1C5JG96_9ACTN|nr:sugar ABC transporter permease [Micromonospora inositola]SCG69331.1 carbohydrate ABC transporter membrane protein 1, CUT1 family [Micromonospora inositola]
MTAVTSDGSTRRGRSGLRLRRGAVGWGFALPFTVLFLAFMAGPVIASLLMSFTDIRSADLRNPLGVNVVGMHNYSRLLHDELFVKAAVNTAIFVLAGVPLTMVAGLAAALGLNSGLTRFRALFRVGYYLPVVTSIVAVAVVWRFLLQPDSGLFNSLLRLVGVHGPNWLFDTRFALPSLIVMAAWRNLGYQMVIFLAGLQAIPQELYEAARIDGATTWQQLRYVTLPSLRPTLLFVGVIATIGYLQFFEEPLVMTQGMPLNSTLSVSYHIYNQFGFGNYGYASAMSYVLFLSIVLMSILWFRLLRSEQES